MLLNSVVLVLREVLEAALLLSVLIAISRILSLRLRWVLAASAAGLTGSIIFGLNMHRVSDLLEGVGQEVTNAMMQLAVFGLLVATVYLVARCSRKLRPQGKTLPILMVIAVTLAITREGSEILIYTMGFWHMEDYLSSIGIGSLVGASIGLSVGILFYYLLLSQPTRLALFLSTVLLMLIGSGMCAQAIALLIQADWITVAGPLWDTSRILPESSLPGQLLYALIGYEASPSSREVMFYLGSMLAMTVAVIAGRRSIISKQVSQ
ncbi:MAG: FTR1 family protein [Lysobacterales bacterium]